MPNKLPEPTTIISALGGGAIDLAEGPVIAAINTAGVAQEFANNVKRNMDDLKKGIPQDPSAIPDFAVRAVTHTISDGLGFFEGLGKAATQTFESVRGELRRITG